MLLSGRSTRLVVAGAIGAGAMLFGGIPSALADVPTDCTAADLAEVSSGVAATTAAYLFAHPDVNDFFTSLKGRPKSQIHDDVQNYLNANPQTKADLQGIRQPLVDLKSRCQ